MECRADLKDLSGIPIICLTEGCFIQESVFKHFFNLF